MCHLYVDSHGEGPASVLGRHPHLWLCRGWECSAEHVEFHWGRVFGGWEVE